MPAPKASGRRRPYHNALPRWALHAEALFWRTLMEAGMALHRLSPQPPPPPTFTPTIPSTLSPTPGPIPLIFYTPPSYATCDPTTRYPTTIHFHSGGFTPGRATDNAILYLLAHAGEVGGNMAFTTLLRLGAVLRGRGGGGGGVEAVVAWYPSTDFTAARRGTNTCWRRGSGSDSG